MTAGALHTFFTIPGMHAPKWNRSAMHYSHGMRRLDRDNRSAFCFTDTTGRTSLLRIQGTRPIVDGRRVQSSLALTTAKADARELTCMTLRGIYSPSAKKSVEYLPVRPAMARAKQVPGRYFPKAIMSDGQKAALAGVKPPQKADVSVPRARFPPIKGLEFMKNSIALLTPPNQAREIHTASYNRKIAQTRRCRRMYPEFQTEVFAISFQGDTRGAYDPNSELHSDYYSITRLNINSAKEAHARTAKNLVRVPTSSESGDFRIVLRGQRKLLHDRTGDFDMDQVAASSNIVHVRRDLSAICKKNSKDLPAISPVPVNPAAS